MSAPSNDWVPLNKAAKRLRSQSGRAINTATLTRWANKGIGGHRLPSKRLNGCQLISISAAKWFIAKSASRDDRSRQRRGNPSPQNARVELALNPNRQDIKGPHA